MNPPDEVLTKLAEAKIPESVISIMSDLAYKALQNPSTSNTRQKRVSPSSSKTPLPFELLPLRFMYLGNTELYCLPDEYLKCLDVYECSDPFLYEITPLLND